GRRSARTRRAASPPATGSTAAASRAPPCMSTQTARSCSPRGAPTSAGPAAPWRGWAPRRPGPALARVAPSSPPPPPPPAPAAPSVGSTHATGGSRVPFATGQAVVDTTKTIIQELCVRAARMWKVDPEGVVWEDGHAKPASSNVGTFAPLSLKEIAAKSATTGGPIVAAGSGDPAVVAPGFAPQLCDLEVDPETGKGNMLRFVRGAEGGRAHPPSTLA